MNYTSLLPRVVAYIRSNSEHARARAHGIMRAEAPVDFLGRVRSAVSVCEIWLGWKEVWWENSDSGNWVVVGLFLNCADVLEIKSVYSEKNALFQQKKGDWMITQ